MLQVRWKSLWHVHNFLTNQLIKEFWKSVHICQSYYQSQTSIVAYFFWDSIYFYFVWCFKDGSNSGKKFCLTFLCYGMYANSSQPSSIIIVSYVLYNWCGFRSWKTDGAGEGGRLHCWPTTGRYSARNNTASIRLHQAIEAQLSHLTAKRTSRNVQSRPR